MTETVRCPPLATDAMPFTLHPARYAKGLIAVHCPSPDGYKTRAARLAEALSTRYTHREKSYLLTQKRAGRFLRLYEEGWDAHCVTLELLPPPEER